MTDTHLRELERRFRASGSLGDEAAWLRARVQSGELEQSGLELAGYCGHEAAMGDSRPLPGHESDPLAFAAWVDGLKHWGPEFYMTAVGAVREEAWPDNRAPRINSGGDPHLPYLLRAFRLLSGAKCTRTVKDRIVPLALGDTYPVRDRVEARKAAGE